MFQVITFFKSLDGVISGYVESAPMKRAEAKRFRNRQRRNGKVAVISRWAFLSF